jgi:hypothetical protein
MTSVAIPSWTAGGVLPPTNPASATSTHRSPYKVNLTDLVLHFNTSKTRGAILVGFLDFRAALHAVGLTDGFQWLDGSFLEDIETTEDRAPKDLDLVTFYHLPPGQTQQSLFAANPQLFTRDQTKHTYLMDAFFVQLDSGAPEALVGESAYWYSLWSHRRDERWKGFLQIDLAPDEDKVARANLASGTTGGGQP